MDKIQLIVVNPEQLQEAISEDIKKQLKKLEECFEPKSPKEYLTRKEAAQLLKVDQSTIWNWTNSKILRKHGIGNRVYYLRSEIEAAMKAI